MSVTLTENRTTYSLGRTLADYDLQHSGEENEFTETTNSRPAPQGAGNNPADWEDNFRRVPDYRPVDHALDFAYRDTTQNGIERAFIWNMFSGIVLTSVRDMFLSPESVILTSLAVHKQALESNWRQAERHLLPLAGWRRALMRVLSRLGIPDLWCLELYIFVESTLLFKTNCLFIANRKLHYLIIVIGQKPRG